MLTTDAIKISLALSANLKGSLRSYFSSAALPTVQNGNGWKVDSRSFQRVASDSFLESFLGKVRKKRLTKGLSIRLRS